MAKKSIAKQVLGEIRKRGRGSAFSAADFLGVTPNRATLNRVLSRLKDRGVIRAATAGVYYYPRLYAKASRALLGEEAPASIEKVVAALLRKRQDAGERLQEPPLASANRLGLSTLVQGRYIFLTTQYSRKVKIGNVTVELRNASQLPEPGTSVGSLYQALRFVGNSPVLTPAAARRIRNMMKPGEVRALRKQRRIFGAGDQEFVGWILNGAPAEKAA